MDRATVDKLISSTAVVVAIVLLAAGGGLLFASSFIHSQVSDQLSAQRITFPEPNSPQITNLPEADRVAVDQYAGQQLTTGAQAEVFANHYINAHLQDIGGGMTYSELSNQARANPDDSSLAERVDSVFRGETLRGMLLNAYAFDTMATVARVAAYTSVISSVVLIILACLGFGHAKKTTKKRR